MDSETPSRLCRRCGGKLHRKHRGWWQKLVYYAVFQCDSCGAVEARRYRLEVNFPPTHSRCPRCWSHRLKRLSRRDHVEGYQRGIFRTIQRWMGASLYYCEPCRLQFYDLRPRGRKRSANSEQPERTPSLQTSPPLAEARESRAD